MILSYLNDRALFYLEIYVLLFHFEYFINYILLLLLDCFCPKNYEDLFEAAFVAAKSQNY